MHHSMGKSFTIETPTAADGFFFDLGSFYEQAELLSDPRDPRGKRYALALMLSPPPRAMIKAPTAITPT